jgi:DNA polymerase III delta prime subunit
MSDVTPSPADFAARPPLFKVSQRELRSACPICGNPGPFYHFAKGSMAGARVLVEVNTETRRIPHGFPSTHVAWLFVHTHDASEIVGKGIAALPPAGEPTIHVPTSADVWTILAAAATVLPRVLLYGPPGTGKTQLAMTTGVPAGLPVYRVNMTEDTPAAELRGGFIPQGDRWIWNDGPALLAFRNGGRLVVDEITRASDDALSFLLGVLDGHDVTLPNGEVIPPSPNLSVWATTNDDATALTDALADRFVVKVKCDKVNPAALATLPPSVANAVTAGTTGRGVSMREAAEFTRLNKCGAPAWLAAKLVWERRSNDVLTAMDITERLSPYAPAD